MPTCSGEGKGSFFACLTIPRSTFEAPKPGMPGDDCHDWQPANAAISKRPVVSRNQVLSKSSFIAIDLCAG
jgi:hypothetical protein